jgi:hypothetical protein
MAYRNGRQQADGDIVIKLNGGMITDFGVLHSVSPGDSFVNGYIATTQSPVDYACVIDCLHVDDLAAILKEKGLDVRPGGKAE